MAHALSAAQNRNRHEALTLAHSNFFFCFVFETFGATSHNGEIYEQAPRGSGRRRRSAHLVPLVLLHPRWPDLPPDRPLPNETPPPLAPAALSTRLRCGLRRHSAFTGARGRDQGASKPRSAPGRGTAAARRGGSRGSSARSRRAQRAAPSRRGEKGEGGAGEGRKRRERRRGERERERGREISFVLLVACCRYMMGAPARPSSGCGWVACWALAHRPICIFV